MSKTWPQQIAEKEGHALLWPHIISDATECVPPHEAIRNHCSITPSLHKETAFDPTPCTLNPGVSPTVTQQATLYHANME
jgi:hypothetical protein